MEVKNILISFFSVVIGALVGYLFSIRTELKKDLLMKELKPMLIMRKRSGKQSL